MCYRLLTSVLVGCLLHEYGGCDTFSNDFSFSGIDNDDLAGPVTPEEKGDIPNLGTEGIDILGTMNQPNLNYPQPFDIFVTPQIFHGVLQISAVISSVALQLTPIPTMMQIMQRHSTGVHQPLTYLMTLFSSILWLIYGLLRNDLIIILPNLSGLVLGSFYVFTFYRNCHDPVQKATLHLHCQLILGASILLGITNMAWSSNLALIGFIAAASNVVGYAAPLSTLGKVLRDKCSASMPQAISLGNFFSSACWLCYGTVIEDNYISVASLLGVMVGLIQVLVLVVYPVHKYDCNKGEVQENIDTRLTQNYDSINVYGIDNNNNNDSGAAKLKEESSSTCSTRCNSVTKKSTGIADLSVSGLPTHDSLLKAVYGVKEASTFKFSSEDLPIYDVA